MMDSDGHTQVSPNSFRSTGDLASGRAEVLGPKKAGPDIDLPHTVASVYLQACPWLRESSP